VSLYHPVSLTHTHISHTRTPFLSLTSDTAGGGGGITHAEAMASMMTEQTEVEKKTTQQPLSLCRKIMPCSVFLLAVLVESIIVMYLCSMFVPYSQRQADNPTITHVSLDFVTPYKANLPRFYDGNLTTMLQGQVWIVSFYVPMLSCAFLTQQDAYIQAVADACLVPPAHGRNCRKVASLPYCS